MQCDAGKEVSSDKTACSLCAAVFYNPVAGGTCLPCGAQETGSADHLSCIPVAAPAGESSPIVAIAAGAGGAVALIALFGCIWLRRRGRHSKARKARVVNVDREMQVIGVVLGKEGSHTGLIAPTAVSTSGDTAGPSAPSSPMLRAEVKLVPVENVPAKPCDSTGGGDAALTADAAAPPEDADTAKAGEIEPESTAEAVVVTVSDNRCKLRVLQPCQFSVVVFDDAALGAVVAVPPETRVVVVDEKTHTALAHLPVDVGTGRTAVAQMPSGVTYSSRAFLSGSVRLSVCVNEYPIPRDAHSVGVRCVCAQGLMPPLVRCRTSAQWLSVSCCRVVLMRWDGQRWRCCRLSSGMRLTSSSG